MAKFNYEWWTISIRFTNGMCDCEFKGKNKENIISQIKNTLKKSIAEKEDISHIL